MKFYKSYFYYGPYFDKIIFKKLNAIYSYYNVEFFKNGKIHNSRNAAIIYSDGYKYFYFYGKSYGNNFTKSSWRKFAKSLKLRAFL